MEEPTGVAAEQEQRPARVAKRKAAERVTLRMLSVLGQAALVEYAEAGRPVRVTIPVGLVADDLTADPADLAQGAPYGIPWERAPLGHVTMERIADELRNAGIWTAEDLRTRPRAALGALQAAYGIDLAALTKFTEESHG